MSDLIVTIKQGKLRGDVGTDIKGDKFYKFLGIPYAKPPIGELRFKAPQPAEPWTGIRDATKEGDVCYQKDMIQDYSGSEDCLTLNVYTKELPQSKSHLKPTMVYLHGGAFTMGSGSPVRLGPEFLITSDVVLVVINYRLGILGFLSLEDTSLDVPGNAGLKDQTMALRWVQENIKSFNGDPANVTIFGTSAGAASVHFQILSPSARGLFHKAILQSGCTLNPWVWGSRSAIETAKVLGKNVNSEREALQVLMDVSVERLYEAQQKFKDPLCANKQRPFCPVIEKPNETAFITKSPFDIISSGEYNQVPMIFGYTTREGLLLQLAKMLPLLKDLMEDITPKESIAWQIKRDEKDEKDIVKKIEEVYFKGPDEEDNISMLVTDCLFLTGIMVSLKNHLRTTKFPVYLYRMSIESKLNTLKNMAKIETPGACHGDDIGYLFKSMGSPEITPGSLEEISVTRFVKLWTDFAKCGNPTPSDELGVIWEPVKDENQINYLEIGKELSVGVNPEEERMALWERLLEQYPFVIE